MKSVSLMLLVLISLTASNRQLLVDAQQIKDVAHQAVVRNAAEEASLPPSLLNPFYKNSKIRKALAKTSWFGPGEQHVQQREADQIPRKAIFVVLNHAGLLPQQQI